MTVLKFFFLFISFVFQITGNWADGSPISLSKLKMFVDELPDMPRIQGYRLENGVAVPKSLRIGMYQKLWKFHRDLPPSRVFAYGTSKSAATVPGPTIEAIHGVPTHVSWRNYLPAKHILPWDRSIIPADMNRTSGNGIPTVAHLHGGIAEPESDGNSNSWFTAQFRHRGPTWSKRKYIYHNAQHPGNLWYHDHAMGLTRVNLLAGLVGAYTIRQPEVEDPLGLPHGHEFDRPLVVFDRAFSKDGSIYMDAVGNNPFLHPQWKPEYFGGAIVVNGKAWPKLTVQRRKYRFRIINASNARFFRFFFNNGLTFTHVAADSAYLARPISSKRFLLAPSEIADVIVDFSLSKSNEAILSNNANYPYPTGDSANDTSGQVMKFIIKPDRVIDTSRIPKTLIRYATPDLSKVSKTRYITMHEYTTPGDDPTHLLLNGMRYEDPVTEVPKAGTAEVWNVINLTGDNHPLHIHLGLFKVLKQREIPKVEELLACMNKTKDDVRKCNVDKYASGEIYPVAAHERGWKNVFKMMPSTMTTIVIQFSFIHSNASYPFDVTAEPGYVYHCHILDHEDNAMMRPLKFTN